MGGQSKEVPRDPQAHTLATTQRPLVQLSEAAEAGDVAEIEANDPHPRHTGNHDTLTPWHSHHPHPGIHSTHTLAVTAPSHPGIHSTFMPWH